MRILVIALLAVAALPASADAASLSRSDGTLRYAAGKGERISAELIQAGDGGFLARRAKNVRQRLVPGAGCRRGGAREVRCGGQGVTRVAIAMKRARMSSVFVHDVRVPVAAVGSKGPNTMIFTDTPAFTYEGGPKRDDVIVRDSPGGHSIIRLGAGTDFFDGQPPALGAPDSPATFTVHGGAGDDYLMGGAGADSLDGGSGNDTLVCNGGAATLTGGTGSDTVQFGTLGADPISVTLDGQRNDGTPGQNALVRSDVENAGIGFGTKPGNDDVLIGNDGPNVLIGPGTVRGLGGNDTLVTDNYLPDNHTALDGGDGDDRIDALARNDGSGSPASTPASVVCGPGSDVVFTSAPKPADCERANVGMRARGARPIGHKGVVRARIGCNDPHGCVLGRLLVKLRGHQASVNGPTRAIKIPFGKSRTVRAQLLPRVWKRHRHDRSLRLKFTPLPRPTRIASPAVSTGSYSRTLTVRISR